MIDGLTIKYSLISLLKGILASFVGLIGLVIGSIITPLLGFAAPPTPEGLDPGITMFLFMISGILVSVALGELFKNLHQKFLERFLTLFFFNYLIYGLLQVLEQIIFTTTMNLDYGAVSNCFQSIFLSLAVSLLWKPGKPALSIVTELPKYFSKRNPSDWVWRILLAWLLYVPLYYVVGRIISPLVTPYYIDSSLASGLVLPEVQTMLGMQVVRGALYLAAALPVLILWKKSRPSLWMWLGFSIFIQIAAVPLIQGYWLPLGLRIPHAVELTVDSFIQAYVYARLLVVEQS